MTLLIMLNIFGLDGGVLETPPPLPPPLGALFRQFALLLFRKFLNCLMEHCDHRVAPLEDGDMMYPPHPPRQDSAPLSPS